MKAIVFDLDGTLVDSAPDLHAAAGEMLAAIGRPPLDLDVVRAFIGNGVPKLVERCLNATGGADEPDYAKALAIFNRAYAAAPAVETRPYPGVVPLLEALADEGVALGVCTNKPQKLSEAVLDGVALAPFFSAVVGGDRLDRKKPDPAPLRLCFQELRAGGDRLYIGDSETDEATAAALGVDFALFTGGYRKKPAEDFAARLVFDDFGALIGRI